MKGKVRAFIEYDILYSNSYRFSFLEKFAFPSKWLVRYYLELWESSHIEHKDELVAHMYAYDSTVSFENLSLIHTCHDTVTRERVRQLLCKFIRKVRSQLREKA